MGAFDLASSPGFLVCPVCGAAELAYFGRTSVRCGSCGCLLSMAVLETLRGIVGLPDALGSHACECGHPEMRCLPDGIYRCPACGSEVLPLEDPSSPGASEEGCQTSP